VKYWRGPDGGSVFVMRHFTALNCRWTNCRVERAWVEILVRALESELHRSLADLSIVVKRNDSCASQRSVSNLCLNTL
jgi:hypothetical protein